MAPARSVLRLVTGRPGSGKTELVVRRFLGAGGDLPGRGALVLLPDRGVAGSFRRRAFAGAGSRGFVDTGVETFEGLASGILGVGREDLTPPESLSLLLLALEKKLPAPIGRRVRSERFRSALLGWIAELGEAGIGPVEIHRLVDGLPEEDRRLALLADTLEIVIAEEEAQGFVRAGRIPILAARALESDGSLSPPCEVLLVDGFHHFSASRLELLAALAARVPEVIVTLPDPDPGDPWTGGTLVAAHSALAERFDVREERLPGGREPVAPAFLGGADRREEMERIARSIRRSLVEEGRRPSDFLVLFRDAAPYRRAAEAAFGAAGIPHYARFQVEASATAPGRSLLDVVRLAREGVTRETVESIVKNRMFDTAADLADRIVRTWALSPRPASEEEFVAEVASVDPGFASERALPMVRFVREFAAASAAEGARLLRDQWLEWIEPSLREGTFPADEEPVAGAAAARLAGLLGGLAAAAERDEEFAGARAAGFLDVVEEEVRRARVTYTAGEPGGVRLDDFRHGQNAEAPVVFVAGLEASQCPRPYQPGAFWTEADRERLDATGQYRVPNRKTHADEERYLFRRACSRATERLYLTAPAFDPGGGALAESPFRQEVRREFEGAIAGDEGTVERFAGADSVVFVDDVFPFLASRADPAEGDEGGVALAARLLAGLPLEAPRPPRSFLEPVLLEPAAAFRAWIAHREEFSVTELEDYQACPYRYLARYVFGLRESEEPVEYGVPTFAEGQVMHRVLERVEKTGASVEETAEKLLNEARGPFAEHVGHRLLLEEMRRLLVRAIAKDRAFRDEKGWRADEFEFRFGDAEGAPVPLADDVRVRGRIDRVDVGGENLALVVDYKRSERKKGDVGRELEAGRILALPIYARAVAETSGRRVAAAFFLGVRGAKRGGFYDASLVDAGVVPADRKEAEGAIALGADEFRETLARAVKFSLEAVAEIRSGSFPVRPADDKTCDRLGCPYRDLCRVVLAARERGEEGEEAES